MKGVSAIAIAIAVAPGLAFAQSKKECADAYVGAQVDRKDGKLIEARKKLAVCAATSCPAALKRDCAPWLAEVEKEIPTLAVKIEGAPSARVTVDGAPFEGPSPVDPGEHVVRAEAPEMTPSEQRVRLAAGEGRREIAITLAPVASSTKLASPLSVPAIALGAAGLVGLGVFIGLGAAGNAKKAELDDKGCKPNCLRADVASIKTHYIAADVALGLGLASIAAAGVLVGLQLAAPKQAASASRYVGEGGVTLRF